MTRRKKGKNDTGKKGWNDRESGVQGCDIKKECGVCHALFFINDKRS